jgi:alpha-glucosidase
MRTATATSTESQNISITLIGETYLHSAKDLEAMCGKHDDELQLPMDTQLGFSNQLSAANFRQKLRGAELEIGGH